MTRAVVLGAGIVGSVIAADLAEDGWEITVFDRSEKALEAATRLAGGRIFTQAADLTDMHAIREAAAPADIVIGALPGSLGYRTLAAVIEVGRPICDISFMPEDALTLDALARERGVTAIVDIGVAPGLSNLLAGHAQAAFDSCERIEIYVGGLPRNPQPPFEYKAAFSPVDVIEEYVRPARYVEGGRVETREALSGVETMELPGVGTLEAFLTDGLRSLMDTLPVPNMVEKTLRYPGHARLMRAFRDAGLFGTESVAAGGSRVVPRELVQSLLFPLWTYDEGEEDLTVMRVIARGVVDGSPASKQWDLLDTFDTKRGFSSMARTTAFPCTLLARCVADGTITEAGVIPPERLGADEAVLQRVMTGLADRGVELVATAS